MFKPRIFIGSSVAAKHIAEHAAEDLRYDAQPEIWTDDKFHTTRTPIENLFKILDQFHYALFVALPQDVTTKGTTTVHTVRDNVLFEIGLFLGRLGRDRVYLIAPQNGGATSLHLPTDLTGITPSTYDPNAANLQSQIGMSLNEMKRAIRQFQLAHEIFDTSKKVSLDTLLNKGNFVYAHGKPIGVEAQANYLLTDEALEITRNNADGVWEVEIRPAGKTTPTIAKALDVNRLFKITFEAKVSHAYHIVRCVTMNASNYVWVDDASFHVKEKDWVSHSAILNGPANLDILIRIQDEIKNMPAGTLSLRNISVGRVYSY